MTLKQKKKELISKYVHKNEKLAEGQRIVFFSVMAILLLRLAFFIFELVFFSVKGLNIGIISNVLLLPLFFILYMIYDGNKGLSAIPAISAIVRVVVYFSTTFKDVSAAGGNLYTGLFLGIMLIQFAVCVLVGAASKCQAYFKVMQAINLQIQKEFLGKGKRR